MSDVVTLVTRDATLDNLSSQDYRDIFTELRQNLSLAQLTDVMRSQFSRASWSKYERNEMELNRTMRNELRQAVGLPCLPETVADAVNSRTSPDAAVWSLGDGIADRVILVGGNYDDVMLHVNGVVTVADDSHMPIVVDAPRNRGYTASTQRKPTVRPVASVAQNERRAALGASWAAVIDAGLAAMEEAAQ